MRLYRNAIILFVVVALLIVAYVFISKSKGSDTAQTETTDTTINILSVDSEKINQVTVKDKESQFVFEKKDKDWALKSPQGIRTSTTKVSVFMSQITGVTAEKAIGENLTDLKQYGLSNPVVEMSINTTDGKTQTLQLGDKTPTKSNYYLMDKKGNKVYLVNSYLGDQLLNIKSSIKEDEIFDIKPEETLGLTMERAGKLVFKAKQAQDGSWGLTAPFEANADMKTMTTMVDAVAKGLVINFIEENATDLDKYGLKNPAYTLEIESLSQKSKMLLGSEKKDSVEIYAKLENSNEIFTIGADGFNFLDKPLKEIVESLVGLVNIEDVSQLSVDMDGQKTLCTIQTNPEDSDKDQFTVNGTTAPMKDENGDFLFRNYYQALISISLGDIEPAATPTAKPEITITYTLKKAPGEIKIQFISKDSNNYYVMKNGKYTNFIVGKKQFDEAGGIRDTFKKLMDALNLK